jgi:hypothetical protein
VLIRGHQSRVFGLRRLSCLRRFVGLSHWGLLRAYRDFRLRLGSLSFRPGGCHFTPSRTFSDWAGSVFGSGWSCSLDNTAPTDNVVPAGS